MNTPRCAPWRTWREKYAQRAPGPALRAGDRAQALPARHLSAAAGAHSPGRIGLPGAGPHRRPKKVHGRRRVRQNPPAPGASRRHGRYRTRAGPRGFGRDPPGAAQPLQPGDGARPGTDLPDPLVPVLRGPGDGSSPPAPPATGAATPSAGTASTVISRKSVRCAPTPAAPSTSSASSSAATEPGSRRWRGQAWTQASFWCPAGICSGLLGTRCGSTGRARWSSAA